MCRIFQCKLCKKTFLSNSGLWYHTKKCDKKIKAKILKCKYCNYETQGPKCILQNHVYSKHTPENERPFQCEYCNRGFAQKSHLHTHLKKRHNIISSPVQEKKIVEYHITVLNKEPTSKKLISRINIYKENPIISAKYISNYTFWHTKTLKPSHLHYDAKKGYIHYTPKTKSDLNKD